MRSFSFILLSSLALIGAGCPISLPFLDPSPPKEAMENAPKALPAVAANFFETSVSSELGCMDCAPATTCTHDGNVTILDPDAAQEDRPKQGMAFTVALNGKQAGMLTPPPQLPRAEAKIMAKRPGMTFIGLWPTDVGGYILYDGPFVAHGIDHCSGKSTEIAPPATSDAQYSINDISLSGSMAAFTGHALSSGSAEPALMLGITPVGEARIRFDAAPMVISASSFLRQPYAFIGDAAFSPDGRYIAFAVADGPESARGAVYVYDLETGGNFVIAEREDGAFAVDGWQRTVGPKGTKGSAVVYRNYEDSPKK